MIYKFILVSDEIDDFRRDITIDSEATFFELHETILDSVGYAKDQITSFFLCDEDWSKKAEITLIDMDHNSDEDVYVMEKCRLSELLEDERQKLIYVFEPLTERCFFMELREITWGKSQDKPQIVKSVGNPPEQISPYLEDLDVFVPRVDLDADLDLGNEEDFFDDDFNLEDYDEESFNDY
ncbi:MAG: hypothetical protein FWF52_09665 [Candidatus Azobacteroides sp.]|nr:hypothetical protein [Candidatus Azobacteroides sp.]